MFRDFDPGALWTGLTTGSTAYVSNGLNQQVAIGAGTATWDSKGNLTSEPQSGKTYAYSSENLLTSVENAASLSYDPALRLYQVTGAATTRFAYDGANAIAEYNGSNVLQRRFVFAEGVDDPIVQYEGTGTTDRRFMGADERGSIISLTDSSGALLAINRYDEYGKPQSTNAGRFQYTGQKWITELGLYDYKFRFYAPHLGIFHQTDPIGYAPSPNLYTYVLNDPVNLTDPLGLCAPGLVGIPRPTTIPPNQEPGTVYATYRLFCVRLLDPAGLGGGPSFGPGGVGGEGPGGLPGGPAEPPPPEPPPPPPPQCPTGPNVTAAADGGLFGGRGAGSTIGLNWNMATGRIRYFTTARIGSGLGFSLGAGVGISTSEPSPGISQTLNAGIGWKIWGVAVNYSPNQTSLSGGVSAGPKYALEASKTTNLTATVDLYSGNCMTSGGNGW